MGLKAAAEITLHQADAILRENEDNHNLVGHLKLATSHHLHHLAHPRLLPTDREPTPNVQRQPD
jgi:hypothetical protein